MRFFPEPALPFSEVRKRAVSGMWPLTSEQRAASSAAPLLPLITAQRLQHASHASGLDGEMGRVQFTSRHLFSSLARALFRLPRARAPMNNEYASVCARLLSCSRAVRGGARGRPRARVTGVPIELWVWPSSRVCVFFCCFFLSARIEAGRG